MNEVFPFHRLPNLWAHQAPIKSSPQKHTSNTACTRRWDHTDAHWHTHTHTLSWCTSRSVCGWKVQFLHHILRPAALIDHSFSLSLFKINTPTLKVCETSLWPLITDMSCVFQPIFLNEVLVKLPTDPSGDEPLFHISHIDRVYTLRAESINER